MIEKVPKITNISIHRGMVGMVGMICMIRRHHGYDRHDRYNRSNGHGIMCMISWQV